MTDRPIIFSRDMVLALLREARNPGTGKTMTRRLAWRFKDALTPDGEEGLERVPSSWQKVKPGDRLWVRETWSHDADDIDALRRELEDVMAPEFGHGPYYRATEVAPDTLKWIPAIHMPRWASRLTLIVGAVKMEPLTDISEEDARAEGFASGQLNDGFDPKPIGDGYTISSPGTFASASGMFLLAWSELHPDWDCYSSPEVVALTFRPALANIDAAEARAA